MSFPDDISQQGAALRALVEHNRAGARLAGAQLSTVVPARPRSVIFTGMGTSLHVARAVQHSLSEETGVPVLVVDAGELLHFGLRTVSGNDLVIAISQSGESVETLRVTEALRDHPHLIALTNNPESPMAKLAHLSLDMAAGEEAAISTKTYTNALALVLLLAKALAGRDLAPLQGRLERISEEMDTAARAGHAGIAHAAEALRDARALYFISRGPSLAAAAQAALTFQEGVHIPAVWMSGGEFRHGPMELAGAGNFAVLFAPEGPAGDLLRSLARELAEIGSDGVLFTSANDEPVKGFATLRVAAGEPELLPLAAAVPQELLLDQMARDRGRTAGRFEHGGKVTRRE
jgi:glucosamine--fructose-6-phosphate aminotransferase (isomerizing)